MSNSLAPRHIARPRRRILTAILGAVLASATLAGTAAAKEIGSGTGAGTTTPAACSPVSNLTYKGDARVGELGVGSISVSYGVKPCDAGQAVRVSVTLALTANPSAVAHSDADAPLNGKFTVFGVLVNTSYRVTVSVFDASTGASLGSSSIFAAAKTKPV